MGKISNWFVPIANGKNIQLVCGNCQWEKYPTANGKWFVAIANGKNIQLVCANCQWEKYPIGLWQLPMGKISNWFVAIAHTWEKYLKSLSTNCNHQDFQSVPIMILEILVRDHCFQSTTILKSLSTNAIIKISTVPIMI